MLEVRFSDLQVLQAVARAEKKKKPTPVELFTDVYAEMPIHLQKQMNSMKEHVMRHKKHYPVDKFEPM
jgi:hypothetical protein